MGEGDRRTSTSHYRRNRTLSGVQRSVDESSPRHQVHDLTRRRRKVGGVFLICVSVAAVLTLLLTQFTASVALSSTSTDLTKSFAENEASYEEAIGSYFGLNPAERLRFLLNEESLSEYVGALFPEVKSLQITKGDNSVETRFAVTFRKPVAGWQIRNSQYYVDNEGVVFDTNYYSDPSVQIVDESGVEPEEGTAVASGRLLGFVGRVVSLSEGRGYTATKAVLPADTTRRLDVTFKGVKPVVRFSIDRGAGEQVSDMDRSLKYLSSKNLRPSYVDVRVGERAIYR